MDSEDLYDNDISQSRISELEAREAALVEEKRKLEEDFGMQRAKLKGLFMQKEEELKTKVEESSTLLTKLQEQETQLLHLQRELDEARSQATIAQCTAENSVEVERRKCREEVATVKQLMKEDLNNADDHILRLKEQLAVFDAERRHYKSLYEQRIEESDVRRNDSLLSTGVLNAVTKSFAKKVPSLSSAHSTLVTPEKNSTQTTATSPGSGEHAENLEDSMKKAQEDAALLKSLLMPLEEEIAALKGIIVEQDVQLRAQESQKLVDFKSCDVLESLVEGKSSEELVQELDQKLYNEEKKAHSDLQNTWKKANDQYLDTQRQHLKLMRRIRSILTPEQLKTLYDLQHMNSKDEESSPSPAKALLSGDSSRPFPGSLVNISQECSPDWKYTATSASDNGSSLYYEQQKCDLLTFSSPLEKREFSSSQEELERLSSEDTSSTALLDSGCEGQESDINSLNAETFFGNGDNTHHTKFNPDKLPQLTDDQKRALSEVDLKRTVRGDENGDLLVDNESPTRGRLVSEKDWLKLQEELKKSALFMMDTCQLCLGFESQLKKVEGELRESRKEVSNLQKATERQKEELLKKSQYRKKMESKWKFMTEDFAIKEKNMLLLRDSIKQAHSKFFYEFKKEASHIHDTSKSLSQKHKEVHDNSIRLQKENDDLVGKHSQHSREMQNEIINLPDTMEDMQLLLLKYREDIIAAKVAKESIEADLKSKISFLNDQVSAEQHEKDTIEMRLTSEIEQLRESSCHSESLEQQLSVEKDAKNDLEGKVTELEKKLSDTTTRYQQFITGLKKNLEDQDQLKKDHEKATMDLKSRVSALQLDLKVSETVQRDFVRLSQSLQVQLEKIRQSEKEVRWQHEEDVNDCNNCNQPFTAVGRRKNHCRHCGKIFCADCITKTVTSGPHKRISKVCDVCHTLLVQDATPFFSTEPPQTPD